LLERTLIQKLNRSLRNVQYKVKPTEVYPVTPTINDQMGVLPTDYNEADDDDYDDGEEETRADVINNNTCNLNATSSQQRSDNVRDEVPVAEDPIANQLCLDNLQGQAMASDGGNPDVNICDPDTDAVVTDKVLLGATPESPQVEVPPVRRRPKRNVGPPRRFDEYVLY